MKVLRMILFLAAVTLRLFAGEVFVVELNGVINPISASYLENRLSQAEEMKAELVIIQLDTPGGLDSSMRKIVQKILDSKVPVITQVYPKGARAASAGLFVALASDYVAMAEGTNLGAAHPIYVNGGTVSEKITNDAAAYIRSLAEKRGKNTAWVEEAVRKSASITETEAVKLKVADTVSNTAEELIEKLDGKLLKRLKGEIKLKLKNAAVKKISMSGWESVLQVIGDPNIAYILLILGVFGLIFEFTAPGTLIPGIIGGVFIILSLYSMGSISVSFAGAAFLLLAFILFVLEIKTPAHGLIGIAGLLSLILGSFLLFNPLAPYFRISLPVVITMVLLTGS
ncbi:MAG: nodulation protein NfeD, partial [Candidatus Firestonebacteria bacterium]